MGASGWVVRPPAGLFPSSRLPIIGVMDPPQATVGSLAPAFDLPCTPAGRASLADYRGRWLMLIFYPRDFSLVCPTELSAVSARIEEFSRQGCDVLGISSDGIESHMR